MFRHFFCSALILLSSQTSFAFERSFFVGLGLLSKNIGTFSGSVSGEPTLFGANFFQLIVSGFFKISDLWAIAPSITGTPIGPGSPENGETYRVFTIAPRLAYNLGSSWDVHFGPGLYVYQIFGTGGTAVVNNGGTPVNFPLPNSLAHAINLMIDLGFGLEKDGMRLDLDLFMTGVVNRRTTNLILSITYGIS
jgi:hypothetical protein